MTNQTKVVEYCEMKGSKRLLDRKIFLRSPNNVLPLGNNCFSYSEAKELAAKNGCLKKDVRKVAQTKQGYWTFRYLIIDKQGMILLENGQKIKAHYS